MIYERSDTGHDIDVLNSKGVGPLRKSGVNVDYKNGSKCMSKSVINQHSWKILRPWIRMQLIPLRKNS